MRELKPRYAQIFKIPVWAIYFLIISTILLSLVILTNIWFPHLFDDAIFWKMFYSYLTLIVSTIVISHMAEAIKAVQNKMPSQEEYAEGKTSEAKISDEKQIEKETN